MSVKRHSRQVLPTPESPISSSRNSTSYCFAMAGTQGGPRVAGGRRRAQPRSASAIAAGGEKEAARPRRWPRPLARSLEQGSAAAAGARRREARAGGRWEGTAAAAAPARPSSRPLRRRRSGRGGGERRGPRCRPGRGSPLSSQGPRVQGPDRGRGGATFASFHRRSEWRSWDERSPNPPRQP